MFLVFFLILTIKLNYFIYFFDNTEKHSKQDGINQGFNTKEAGQVFQGGPEHPLAYRW